MDKYQERYKKHQAFKKGILTKLMQDRYSERLFGDGEIPSEQISDLLYAASLSPSSCNRDAILLEVFRHRDDKALLGGLLVGGVGWIHRANIVILFISDNVAYKENLDYMKYLDTGFKAQNIYLKCTELGLACCFVNPNVREEHKKYFDDYFLKDDQTLTGAMAIGVKDDRS